MSRFSSLVSSALGRARSFAGESVTYTPVSGATPVTVQAIRGVFEDDSETVLGVMEVETRVVDWLIAVADLPEEPAAGDTVGHGSKTYEVVSARGEPPWRYSDPGETQYRIHAQEVDTP